MNGNKKMRKIKKMICVTLSVSCFFILMSCNTGNGAEKKLYAAIINNNYQGVVEVLRDNPEVNLEDIGTSEITNFSMRDRRALGIAIDTCSSNTDKIPLLLIKEGADVNSILDYKTTYLMESTLVLTEPLLKAGADPLIRDEEGKTALDYVINGAKPTKKNAVRTELKLLTANGCIPDAKTLHTCINNPDGYEYALEILEMVKKEDKKIKISKALEFAIYGNDQKLLSESSSQSIPEKERKYIALYASKNCKASTLKRLNRDGLDFNIKDEGGNTPLDLAAQYNTVEAVKVLAEMGINIKNLSPDDDVISKSPIINALIGGKKENVNFFLSQGIDFPDNEYESGWSSACSYGNEASLNILFENGVKPDNAELLEGYFQASLRDDNVDMFGILLSRMPFKIKDEVGASLLANLSDSNEDCARRLLKAGVQPDAEAIARAVSAGYDDLAEIMTKKIKGINDIRPATCTPLISAVTYGNFKIVKLLISKGSDINYLYKDEGGYTESAIHVAAYSPSKDILKYLIDHGADLTLKNSDGDTPYDLAKQAGFKKNIELIKEKM